MLSEKGGLGLAQSHDLMARTNPAPASLSWSDTVLPVSGSWKILESHQAGINSPQSQKKSSNPVQELVCNHIVTNSIQSHSETSQETETNQLQRAACTTPSRESNPQHPSQLFNTQTDQSLNSQRSKVKYEMSSMRIQIKSQTYNRCFLFIHSSSFPLLFTRNATRGRSSITSNPEGAGGLNNSSSSSSVCLHSSSGEESTPQVSFTLPLC